jgi:hypothetical protein
MLKNKHNAKYISDLSESDDILKSDSFELLLNESNDILKSNSTEVNIIV